MQNPRLAARYAKSLLDLAIEHNSLDATLQDMQLLDHICKINREFTVMLRSPIISSDKKGAIINAVWEGKVNPLTQSFVNLLVKKGRESNLDEIAQAFIAQFKELKKIKVVHITTAFPIDDSVKNKIVSKVAAGVPLDTLEVQTHVNPDLIGGFVIEMDDKLFDSSVLRDLNNIKTSFLDYSYVSQLR